MEAESYTLQQYFTCNRNEFISDKVNFMKQGIRTGKLK